MKRASWTTLALLVALAPAARAEEKHGHRGKKEHAHESPHGGQVKTVGKYHFELKREGDVFLVWLLDKKMGALSPEGRHGALVVLAGKHKQKAALKVDGDHLKAHVEIHAKKAIAVVKMKLDGKIQSGRFRLGESHAGDHH